MRIRAADAGVAKLLSRFAGNEELASAVRKVASIYNAKGRPDKAMELWTMNVEASPDSVDAMLSQMDIIYAVIDNNDVDDATVDAEVEKLLTRFAKQPSLPQQVLDMGSRYRDKKDYDRAIHFYNLVNQKWPRTDFALWARVAIGKTHILRGDDAAVEVGIDEIIADFHEHPKMTDAMFQLGEEYHNKAFRMKNKGLKAEYEECLQKAITVWERIIPLESGPIYRAYAYYFSADCYVRMKEYEKAITYYMRYADNWPNARFSWEALFRAARTYKRLTEFEGVPPDVTEPKIKAIYERILKDYPTSAAAFDAQRWLSHYRERTEGELQ